MTPNTGAARALAVADLAACVADEHHRAVLLEQAGDALVVVHAAVDERDRRRSLVEVCGAITGVKSPGTQAEAATAIAERAACGAPPGASS